MGDSKRLDTEALWTVICDATSAADYVDRWSNAAAVQALTQAAREKKKVLLKGYDL